MGKPQIVCLLEAKSGEEETDGIRASKLGVEGCPSDVIWVLGGEK